MNFGVFLEVPFSVEAVPSEWALIRIGLVLSPTVGVFERVRAWFTPFCFKMRWVQFFICLAAPPEFTVVLRFVRPITFDVFRPLDSAQESCVTPSPAVLILGHTWIHVSTSNSGDVSSKVKAPVNEALSFLSTLEVSDVYLYDRHI